MNIGTRLMNWRWKKQNNRIQHHNRNGKDKQNVLAVFCASTIPTNAIQAFLKRFVWKVNSLSTFTRKCRSVAKNSLKQPIPNSVSARTYANRK